MAIVRTIVLFVACCLAGMQADAKTIVVKGQVGVIGEWALQASLDPPSKDQMSYAGALTLRHIGLCSVDGPEIKTGLATAPIHAGVADRLTLTFGTERCVYTGPFMLTSKVTRGFMRCQTGLQVPVSLWAVP